MRCVVTMLLICFAVFPLHAPAQESPARVTTLYDAFGKAPAIKYDWGRSALVEYAGRRMLFDTGGNLDDFAANVKSLGVDLGRFDFVVLTHRHGDHTSGLRHVLKVNPGVQIYTPVEPANFDTPVGPGLANLIRRRVDSAPEDMHYYDGRYPQRIASGSPWRGAKFAQIRTPGAAGVLAVLDAVGGNRHR